MPDRMRIIKSSSKRGAWRCELYQIEDKYEVGLFIPGGEFKVLLSTPSLEEATAFFDSWAGN